MDRRHKQGTGDASKGGGGSSGVNCAVNVYCEGRIQWCDLHVNVLLITLCPTLAYTKKSTPWSCAESLEQSLK
eukprot:1159881-Pelagomonas_calceolata.AAC.5